jgi:hypothetical protein
VCPIASLSAIDPRLQQTAIGSKMSAPILGAPAHPPRLMHSGLLYKQGKVCLFVCLFFLS